jgi:hypothetical protein
MLKIPGEIILAGSHIRPKVHAQLRLDNWLYCAL